MKASAVAVSNQLPSSINVLISVSLSYDTWVRTKGAVGWVVVDQSQYLPFAGVSIGNNYITTTQTNFTLI